MKKTLILLAATLGLASTAPAHQAWLEQADGKAAVLRFGEFAENLRETSPGLLDHFGKPAATLISAKGESPLTITKRADGFGLSSGAAPSQSIAVEDPVFPAAPSSRATRTSPAGSGRRPATSPASPRSGQARPWTGAHRLTGGIRSAQRASRCPRPRSPSPCESGWDRKPMPTNGARSTSTCRGRGNTSSRPATSTATRANARALPASRNMTASTT